VSGVEDIAFSRIIRKRSWVQGPLERKPKDPRLKGSDAVPCHESQRKGPLMRKFDEHDPLEGSTTAGDTASTSCFEAYRRFDKRRFSKTRPKSSRNFFPMRFVERTPVSQMTNDRQDEPRPGMSGHEASRSALAVSVDRVEDKPDDETVTTRGTSTRRPAVRWRRKRIVISAGFYPRDPYNPAMDRYVGVLLVSFSPLISRVGVLTPAAQAQASPDRAAGPTWHAAKS